MMQSQHIARLLNRVRLRMRLESAGRRAYWFFWGLTAAFLVLLIVSRSLGLITFPIGYGWWVLAAVPGLALLLGAAFHHRPTERTAARRIDLASGTKDLFLTTTLLDRAPGEFKPLVNRDAEAKSPRINPAAVVPFRWERPVLHATGVLCVLTLAVAFLPQWDPFGQVKASQNETTQRKKLEESKKQTLARVEEIKREQKAASEQSDVKKNVENLKASFNQMKRDAKKENARILAGEQKLLSTTYQKVNTEKLREFLSKNELSQALGEANNPTMQKWTRDMQQGSTESAAKELAEMQADLEKLQKETDPVKKAELRKKMRKRLQELSDFAKHSANSNSLNAALQRAMEQMEISQMKGMEMESLKEMANSLELSKMELEQLAQSVKDLKELEKALEAAQMAQHANQKEALDGEQCEGCQSMDDYAQLYAQMLKDGRGGPLGNEGIGEGGVAPENETAKTDFKTEQSKSQVTAGKILLSLKTKGLGETGDAKVEYREAINRLQDGVSEAILTEQIPPGYHDGIKGYFKGIIEAAPPPATDDADDSGDEPSAAPEPQSATTPAANEPTPAHAEDKPEAKKPESK